MKLHLSAATIKALPHPPRGAKPAIHWDDELPGFGIRLMPEPSRVKTFLVQSRTLAGRQFGMKLGRVGPLTADQARAQARKILGAVQTGLDPAAERKAARREHRTWQASPTLAEIDQAWRKANAARWSTNTSESYATWMRVHVLPPLGDRRAHEIADSDVRGLYRRIAAKKSSTANRVLGTLSSLYSWARSAEDEHGRRMYPLITVNPCQNAVGKDLKVADAEREREPESDELERMVAACEARSDLFGAFFLLLLLTGVREGSLLKARWSEFDLDVANPVWRVPAASMKAKKAHRVTLNAEAVALLERIKAERPFSPFGWVSVHQMRKAWSEITAAAGVDDLRIHDWARHFHASLLAGAGYTLVDIGKALAHRSMKSTARYTAVMDKRQRQASTDLGKVVTLAAAK